jgi:hypothetical protein
VQLDVDDGRGDEQWELPNPCLALGAVRGIKADRRLHPPVVWRYLWARCGCRHLSAQILDDVTGGDVPRTSEHDIECLASLIITGLGVGMAVYGLQVPFGLLEPHSILLVLFRVFLLFALLLEGRCAVVVLLLQLLTVLFYELLDFSALLSAVMQSCALGNVRLRHHCQTLDGGACHLGDLSPHPPRQQLPQWEL